MTDTESKPRWRSTLRYGLLAFIVLIVLAVAALFILPRLLNVPAIASRLQDEISRMIGGDVSWQEIEIRFLPAPHGVLRRVHIERPDVTRALAESIEARLAMSPLLRGRVEITAIRVVRPEIDITLAPRVTPEESAQKARPGPITIYRSAMQGIANALRTLAPDAVFDIEAGTVNLNLPDRSIELRELALRAETARDSANLTIASSGNQWEQIKLSAHVDYESLAARAELNLSGAKPQPWLDRYLARLPASLRIPTATLHARLATDAVTSIDCELEARADAVGLAGGQNVPDAPVALRGRLTMDEQGLLATLDRVGVGSSTVLDATLRYAIGTRALSMNAAFDLDIAKSIAYAGLLVPQRARPVVAQLGESSGRVQGSMTLALGNGAWRIAIDIPETDATMRMQRLPTPVRMSQGSVEIDRTAVVVRNAIVTMPAGRVQIADLRYGLAERALATGFAFDVDLARTLELVRRVLPEKNRSALAPIKSLTGPARGSARLDLDRKGWRVTATIAKSDAAIMLADLPAPVRVAAARIDVTPTRLRISRAAVSLLDARALVTADIDDYRLPRLRAAGNVAEASVGEESLSWILRRVQLPPGLAPSGAVSIAAPRVSWQRNGALEVAATARFAQGPELAVVLNRTPGTFEIRSATLRDGESDAMLALRSADGRIVGQFSGDIRATTAAKIFKDRSLVVGSASGNLRFTYVAGNWRDSQADGYLRGESVNLARFTNLPITIDRIDLSAGEQTLRVNEAAVTWAGQKLALRGSWQRSVAGSPRVIEAQLESPGVDVDALVASVSARSGSREKSTTRNAGSEESNSRNGPSDVAAEEKKGRPQWLTWPLPGVGRIALHTDFIRYRGHTIAPLTGTLTVEEQRARVEVSQADYCGISLPLAVEVTPAGYVASTRISAREQQLERVAQCLSRSDVLITGVSDLDVDVSTQGELADLAKNLKGTISAESREGRVMKFAVLANILSAKSVTELFKEDALKFDETGFPYRTLTLKGHFDQGRYIVDESAFRSPAIGLAATGWIDTTYESRLTVLVAPFSRVSDLVRKIPVVGYVVGDTFTSVPVGLSGDIRDPLVVPLGPGAVTSDLLGIFERTLKLPGKLVVAPSAEPTDR